MHLDLYEIDLSRVVSKYIGETEQNLRKIFDAAVNSNAILLFNEADALWGKRSEVRDAHDRYANIEIAFLLQEMEQFDGVVILTTNLRQNLDEAFTRRLDFVIEFQFPDEPTRRLIWEVLLPPRPRARRSTSTCWRGCGSQAATSRTWSTPPRSTPPPRAARSARGTWCRRSGGSTRR